MTPAELHNIYRAEQSGFWWYEGMRAVTRGVLERYVPSAGSRGLEAGCGTGRNAMEFESRYGLRMFGVDLAPLAIQYCRQNSFHRSAAASVSKLPFGDNCFDLVSSIDVLPVLPPGDDERALREFARVLRPGGWLVLRMAAFRFLRSRHSEWTAERHRYTAREALQKLSAADFRLINWTYANAFLFPVAFLKFRVWEPILAEKPHSGVDTMPPAWLNRFLAGMLHVEAGLIRAGVRFRFGQSLMVVAQKPALTRETAASKEECDSPVQYEQTRKA